MSDLKLQETLGQLCTGDFNRVFKKDNREQRKFLLEHWRSHPKVPYSADWEVKVKLCL